MDAEFALREAHGDTDADEHLADAVEVLPFIEAASFQPLIALDFVLDLAVEHAARV